MNHLAKHDRGGWDEALRKATLSGALAAGATAAGVAIAGARDSGNAVAPLNATSHIVWGDSASHVGSVDARHTLTGLALHVGACVFWATFYERLFGRAADRGDVATAVLGSAAIAASAYVTDYHVVPRRFTPGWEERLRPRSLGAMYALLALALPLRGLLRRPKRRGRKRIARRR